MSLYLRQVRAIVRKDLVLELRSRERLVAMGAFAVLAATLFAFSLDSTLTRPQDVGAGLLWVTLVFGGVLGVGRTFHLEGQDGALTGILTAPIARDALFLGKTLANFVILYAIALLMLGVFVLFFSLDLGTSPATLLLVLGLGALGFVALGTLFAAMSSATSLGETLLPILLFPLLIPMVIYGVGATGRLMAGRPLAEVEGGVRMLAAFALVAIAAGATLFRFVVED